MRNARWPAFWPEQPTIRWINNVRFAAGPCRCRVNKAAMVIVDECRYCRMIKRKCESAVRTPALASLPVEIDDVKVFQFAASEMCITLRKTAVTWCHGNAAVRVSSYAQLATHVDAMKPWFKLSQSECLTAPCRAHPPCGNFPLDTRELETRCFRSCPMKSLYAESYREARTYTRSLTLNVHQYDAICRISRHRFVFRSCCYHESRQVIIHTPIHTRGIINMKIVLTQGHF